MIKVTVQDGGFELKQKIFIARFREEDRAEQTLQEHLTNTAERTRSFAEAFGVGQLAHDIASLHDIGKYSEKFQQRVRGSKQSVDHATPGGQVIWKKHPDKLGMFAAYCIMGHHGGLPDGGTSLDSPDCSTLHGRLNKPSEDCSAYIHELTLPPLNPPDIKIRDGFSAAMLIRMIFSTLVDADSLDAEAFSVKEAIRGGADSIPTLLNKLYSRIDTFLNPRESVSELNARRTALLKNCLSIAECASGLFTLTAPTGSGKTIASMSFALKHATKWNKPRVIYVVPYNTIIEQNSKVFEEVLGAKNILQHHSNLQYNDTTEENIRKGLAIENWDYPIVVTSSVQFFQSLFGNSRSACRKLHNIANSVIIFDEAQMIPVPYLIPCVRVIRELIENYGCTAVLTTATQSALESYFAPMTPTEITEDTQELYTFLRRANIKSLPEPLTDEDVVKHLSDHNQVLCIVNTRKMAQSVFRVMQSKLPQGSFHLSTLMYPKHRTKVLDEIRRRLADGQSCRVVSTSLVEAGVDLDFPVVYREEAGLDSIVQATGRCNREGKQPADESFTYVFTSASHKPPLSIEPNTAATRQVLRNHSDAASLEAIKSYFTQLFYSKGNDALDIKQIVPKLDGGAKSFSFPFREIAREFKIIEEDTLTAYVLHEVPEFEARLRQGERSRELFRLLAPYSVSLYRSNLKMLLDIGAATHLDNDAEVCLLASHYYDKYCGVALMPEGGQAIIL